MRSPSAIYSPCGRYRYLLSWPTGLADTRRALGIFANPSTATHEKLDPTCTRWRNFCRRWGYGWADVCNVRAWRETDPRKVPPDPEAIGPENDRHIVDAARDADLIVVGYGTLGGFRGREVIRLLRAHGIHMHALKITKGGAPCHPLYLRGDLELFEIGGGA